MCDATGSLATGWGRVSRNPLPYKRSTGDKFDLTPVPAVWLMECQGSISMGTTVRMASSLPRRTTILKVSSLFMAALTSFADEILWPLMEMMTSCSLSPPLEDRRRRRDDLLGASQIASTCFLDNSKPVLISRPDYYGLVMWHFGTVLASDKVYGRRL